MGHLALPLRFRLSGTLIHDPRLGRLQTLDLYLERNLLRLFTLRGGYSFALKRFFIDLVQSL